MKTMSQKTVVEDNPSHTQRISYEEIEGIKLRDSLFAVYTSEDSDKESEFIYVLSPMVGTGEMVFDMDAEEASNSGGRENCGVYKLQDQRVIQISSMSNWHYKGYIFKDENSWKQFSG